MRATRLYLLAAAILWAGAPHAVAQRQPGSPDRRDELAKVAEALADPDPMQRLANMEAIVKRGDPLQTQVAIRTAFASDDPELRELGMRAVLGSAGELTFDVALPADTKRAYDAARGDALKTRQFDREDPYVGFLARQSFRLHLTVTHYEFPQPGGNAEAIQRRPAPFVIRGSQFSSKMPTPFGSCYVDFAPTPKATLEGTLACDGNWPKLTIAAPAL